MDDLEYITITLTFADGRKPRRRVPASQLSYFWETELADLFDIPHRQLGDLSGCGFEKEST